MSCTSPCLTCTSNNFYSCLTCDPLISSSFSLNNNLCQINPTWYIQISATCMLALFLFFPLFRKRSMVLIRIFDIIQLVAYFKYINGFFIYRHNYIYLDMRSISPWYQGFSLFSLSGDSTIPIHTTEETHVNKLTRIFTIWIGLMTLLVLIGIIKTFCGNAKMQISKFLSKNILNTICIAFYVTIQDIAFFCAQNFYRLSFNSTLSILLFTSAIILSIASILMIRWQFNIINHRYEQDKENRLYNYEVMFMYRMDYDLFQTYKLTNLPSREKTINRYSNIILVTILFKIGYAFLMVSFLFRSNIQVNDQIYSLLGYICFYLLVWYISFPFDARNQYFQLSINILADLILVALLVIPLMSNSEYFNFIYMVIALSLYGLAALSAFLEMFLNVYTFLPYDLYDIGLKIVIQDKQLRLQLQRRKRQQEQNERKIKQLHEQNEKMLKQLMQGKKTSTIIQKQQTHTKNKQDSQHSLQNENKKQTLQQLESRITNNDKFAYPIQKVEQNSSQNDDELNKYRIDLNKKRRVYQFDKKKPFVYSNKLQMESQGMN